MQTIQKTILLPGSNLKHIIDINEDRKNFQASFLVQSQNNQPFEAIVISQSDMDNMEQFPFKQSVDGVFSGEIESNQNRSETYFLILRSKAEVSVNVQIQITPLPEMKEQTLTTMVDTKKNPYVWIVVGGVSLFALYFLYQHFSKGPEKVVMVKKSPVVRKESLLDILKNTNITS